MRRPGYEEQVVTAEVLGAVRVQAVTLRAAPWMRLQRDAPPSARYKRLIVDGAREVGLSESYQHALAGLPASAPSAALTALARAHAVVAVLLFRLRLRALLWPLRAASYALLDATRLAKRLLEGTSARPRPRRMRRPLPPMRRAHCPVQQPSPAARPSHWQAAAAAAWAATSSTGWPRSPRARCCCPPRRSAR